MAPLRSFPWLVLAAWLCALPFADARQGGYRKTEFEQLGLEIPVPRDYRAVPQEPTEKWIALRWIDEETAEDRAKEERKPVSAIFAPDFMVVWIDYVPDPVVTGDDEDEEEEEVDESDLPINSFERYMDRVWRRNGKPMYRLGSPEKLKDRDGNQVFEYILSPRGVPPAWATVFRNGQRSLVMLGRATKDDWEDQLKIWRTIAKKAELSQPEAIDLSKWERFYERRPEYVDPEYRLEVRSKLVRGWEADDTERYIFVFSTRDEPLLRDLKKKLEAIRDEYETLFPPEAPIDKVSTVRVCRDRDEYMQYGGSPGSGGYWNSRAGELVFFDYKEDQERAGEGLEDSRIVLLHEAFHQYIFYSAGEIAPHSWFNEGTGDFFSGARIRGDKVSSIGTNPWRLGFIKSVVENSPSRVVPFEDIMAFEQPEFYRGSRRGLCYAQAWSMIYFLRTSRDVRDHEQWSQILTIYFDTLKADYSERIADLGDEPSAGEKYQAGVESRQAALKAAVEGIDLVELQEAWTEFVLEL